MYLLIFHNDHAQKMYMLSILNPSTKKYAFEKKVMKIIRYSQIFACQLAQKENLQLIKNILPWQQYHTKRQERKKLVFLKCIYYQSFTD